MFGAERSCAKKPRRGGMVAGPLGTPLAHICASPIATAVTRVCTNSTLPLANYVISARFDQCLELAIPCSCSTRREIAFVSSGWAPIVNLVDFWTGKHLFGTTSVLAASGLSGRPVLNPDASQIALAGIPERAGYVGVWSVADGANTVPSSRRIR